MCESSHHGLGFLLMRMHLLKLDVFDVAPRTAAADDFGLEQADDGLGQGVVVRVADAAHRGLDTRLEESFRVTDREGLGRFKGSSQQWLAGLSVYDH